jgi:hypothetical protein
MSVLNPYDTFLDGRPVVEILEETPGALDALIESIGAENSSEAPAPGKWSPAEIIAHLADCEVVFAFRLRQTLAEDNYTIQPFDQGKWGEQYAGMSAAEALGVFKAMRSWNLRLLRGLKPESAGRTVTHPERGTMTFGTIVETMAGHDLNHLSQLQRIAGRNS